MSEQDYRDDRIYRNFGQIAFISWQSLNLENPVLTEFKR